MNTKCEGPVRHYIALHHFRSAAMLPSIERVARSLLIRLGVDRPILLLCPLLLVRRLRGHCAVILRRQLEQLALRQLIIRRLSTRSSAHSERLRRTPEVQTTYPPPVMIFPLLFSSSRYSSIVMDGNL
jgi:hypothetical protein